VRRSLANRIDGSGHDASGKAHVAPDDRLAIAVLAGADGERVGAGDTGPREQVLAVVRELPAPLRERERGIGDAGIWLDPRGDPEEPAVRVLTDPRVSAA
jgi:hypothetical protein